MLSHSTTNPSPPRFIHAELRGGPHSGQVIHIPDDQDQVTFHDDGEAHTYHRLGPAAIFHHEQKVEAMFGERR